MIYYSKQYNICQNYICFILFLSLKTYLAGITKIIFLYKNCIVLVIHRVYT